MKRVTRAEREMDQLLQLAGLRDDLRRASSERDHLRAKLEELAETYASSATKAAERLAEVTAERDRLRGELAAIKEDAAMSASSLASTLTNATEMLDDISALFLDDAAHKFGETTGVSLMDDVRDLMKRAEAAEAALAEERRCRQDSDAKLMGHDDRLNSAAYELSAMRAKYEEVEARLADERGAVADADRYRYIRLESMIEHCTGTKRHNRISWPTIYAAEPVDGGNYRDRFDAAIDAARKGCGE
jgi:chromosome segregation ATPase